MHLSSRVVLLASLVGLSLFKVSAAEAAVCTQNDQHKCWATLSGPNYCQVAVGATAGGMGIACAVTIPQTNTWGGVLHCYAPIGSSGAALLGRGGEEAQNPGPFSSTNASMRIVSLAMTPVLLPSGGGVSIYALRSDGQLFKAVTRWPLLPGGDPRIFFSAEGVSVLPGIQEIAWVPTLGVVATTTANARFVKNGTGWNALGGSAFVLGGNNNSNGHAIYATSVTSNTTAIRAFDFGSSVPDLPGLLAPGPNQNFGPFGRQRPLTVGSIAYAAMKADTTGACAGISPLTPCILLTVPAPFPLAWSPWTFFPTGDISEISPYPMPWTIQDGYQMRHVLGEVWVIAGFQHLKFWAP